MEKEIPFHRERLEQPDKAGQENEKRIRRIKLMQLAFAEVFGSENGKRVLAFIAKDICGHNQSAIGGNPQIGADVTQGTFYNAARLGVYLEIRKFLPERILKEAEHRRPEDDDEFLI